LLSWLEFSVKPSVRPRTHESYHQIVTAHISPTLGNVALTKLTPAHVRTLMNAKTDAGLSPRTVSYIRTVLGIALGQAVRDGNLSRNVASLTKPPKCERHEVQPLTLGDARIFLTKIKGDRNEALFLTAAVLGLRKGELLGLRWQDVDLDGGDLTVRMQAQRIGGHKVLVAPKTEKSRRAVNLPPFVVDALVRHRDRQQWERKIAGNRWKDNNLVFPTSIGTIADSANVSHALHDALERAELPRQRFHDLRHLAASLMLAQDVNPKVMQEILGHSQMSMTMDLYSHLMPSAKKDAAARMEGFLTGTE
ncbi:MAG: site-specific integrase, partial [Thermomicrobia bacterium]|nr:site-specific integrase [Thermomicrobia bacterium]